MGTIWVPELPEGQGSKYKALAVATRAAIADGTLSVGQKLPPVRDLAWELKITPGTVARAYSLLTDEGVLEAAVGRGTFVAPPTAPPETGPAPLPDTPWRAEPVETEEVNLYSPDLPDAGQGALIQEVMIRVAQNPPSGFLKYPSRIKTVAARRAIIDWLGQTPLGSYDENHIVLSHGGQNAIALVMQTVLRGAEPVVLTEDLTYPGFRRVADLLRARTVSVPMDEHGLIPEALEDVARKNGAQVLCTSPEVHNPTGGFTPYERRRALAEVARRCDLHVIEDDCYRLSEARAPSYRMLLPERGWYVSSISKSITPSLRLGFAIAPDGQQAGLRRAAEHSYFGLATPLVDMMTGILNDPRLPGITERVCAGISSYMRMAVNILGRYEVTWREDVPFMWLTLPPGWRAGAFCQAAEAAGVKIRAAEEFAARDARAPHAVRLAINAQVTPASFEAAMQRLRALLDNPPERISV